MKKFLFLLLLITISSFCYAQKIDENKVDDFTGKQLLTTSWEKLGPNFTNVVIFRFRYENGTKYFELVYRNGVNDMVRVNSAIEFKAADGIHELLNSQIAFVRSSGKNEILRYVGDMDFFNNSSIDKIRIHFEQGYDDFDIKDKKRKELIGKSYKLFMNNIVK